MTKKEFYNLPIGTVIYNEELQEIVKFSSGFTPDKEEQEEDFRSVQNVFAEGHDEWNFPRSRYGIEVKEHEVWKVYKSIYDIENKDFKLKIMSRELKILRGLIYNKLNVDWKFTHLI